MVTLFYAVVRGNCLKSFTGKLQHTKAMLWCHWKKALVLFLIYKFDKSLTVLGKAFLFLQEEYLFRFVKLSQLMVFAECILCTMYIDYFSQMSPNLAATYAAFNMMLDMQIRINKCPSSSANSCKCPQNRKTSSQAICFMRPYMKLFKLL